MPLTGDLRPIRRCASPAGGEKSTLMLSKIACEMNALGALLFASSAHAIIRFDTTMPACWTWCVSLKSTLGGVARSPPQGGFSFCTRSSTCVLSRRDSSMARSKFAKSGGNRPVCARFNPVAKHAPRFNRASRHRDRTKYTRKIKHKSRQWRDFFCPIKTMMQYHFTKSPFV